MLAIESIEGKHVASNNLGFQAKLDVVSEEDMRIGGKEIARDTIVIGCNVCRLLETRLNTAEDGGSFRMQFFKSLS